MALFEYTRKQKVNKLDENGKPIPITITVKKEDGTEEQRPTGKFEQEEKGFRGNFNLSRVIRAESLSEDHLLVLLDDGHEETQKHPALKNPGKPAAPGNITEERIRVWVQSEINLHGEDINRYFEETSRMS